MLTDSEILRHQLGAGFRLNPLGDWRRLLRTRSNVLVTGPIGALDAFVKAARSEVRDPILSVACASPIWAAAPTLVLDDVSRLHERDQRRLLRWLIDVGRDETQILSLSPTPLFPLVRSGDFDPDLYYRLNTIYLEIQSL
jgi:hypothetical protein